jgi:small-conductance mechanosensitive channel
MNGLAGLAQTATPPGVSDGTDPLTRPGWLPEAGRTGFYRVVLAVAVAVRAYDVSKLTPRLLGRRIARRFMRPSVRRTVPRGIQAATVVVGALSGSASWDSASGPWRCRSGVLDAVVGIVLAPISGNVISAVFILTEQPYEIGVELSDVGPKGFVEGITLLDTKVFTLETRFRSCRRARCASGTY